MPTPRLADEAAEPLAAQIALAIDGLVVADALRVLEAAKQLVTTTATFQCRPSEPSRSLTDEEADEALTLWTGDNFAQLARRYLVSPLEVRLAIARRKRACAVQATPTLPAPDAQG